jgi:hypothetical protein
MVVGAIVGEARLHPTSMLTRSKEIKRNLGHIISSREFLSNAMIDRKQQVRKNTDAIFV